MKSMLFIILLCISCAGDAPVDEEYSVKNQCEIQQVKDVICNIPCETNHCYQNCRKGVDTVTLDWSWTMCFTQWSPSD